MPTGNPLKSPMTGIPTTSQTGTPSNTPIDAPTRDPTNAPTSAPITSPTNAPTGNPAAAPTNNPTDTPTGNPAAAPTNNPTDAPTGNPTAGPTTTSTNAPTGNPTAALTNNPTDAPTGNPTVAPTTNPTDAPTGNPTAAPTNHQTDAPTGNPTVAPTNNPTDAPTGAPTGDPTAAPTNNPTDAPTVHPTSDPTSHPTGSPTSCPTHNPTDNPTHNPTAPPIGMGRHLKLALPNDNLDAVLVFEGSQFPLKVVGSKDDILKSLTLHKIESPALENSLILAFFLDTNGAMFLLIRAQSHQTTKESNDQEVHVTASSNLKDLQMLQSSFVSGSNHKQDVARTGNQIEHTSATPFPLSMAMPRQWVTQWRLTTDVLSPSDKDDKNILHEKQQPHMIIGPLLHNDSGNYEADDEPMILFCFEMLKLPARIQKLQLLHLQREDGTISTPVVLELASDQAAILSKPICIRPKQQVA